MTRSWCGNQGLAVVRRELSLGSRGVNSAWKARKPSLSLDTARWRQQGAAGYGRTLWRAAMAWGPPTAPTASSSAATTGLPHR